MSEPPGEPYFAGSVQRSVVYGTVIQIGHVKGDVTIVTAPRAEGVDGTGLERLAQRMSNEIRRLTGQRRLYDGEPLPVTWRTVGPPVSDHWSVIRRDGRESPLHLDGGFAGIGELVGSRVPTGRVVLLGGPGSGKTSLIVEFARQCLERGDARVPVLLRLSTWDPSRQTLFQWIGQRIVEDYGVTGTIPVHRLLPVLDGLDEMNAELRGTALKAVNAHFAAGGLLALLLTSRSEEYQGAIDRPDADVLTGAAVVEIQGLAPEPVRDHLRRATKPARAGEWDEVFAHLRSAPRGPLARALTTPLAVTLTRLAYCERDADPRDLLAHRSRESVETLLLEQAVPAFYPDPPEEPGPDGRVRRRAAARRSLIGLARHLRTRDTQDLQWWELPRRVPWIVLMLTVAVPCGLVVSLGVGPQYGIPAGIVFGLSWLVPVGGPKPGRMLWKRTGEAVGVRLLRATISALLAASVFSMFFTLGIWLSGPPWWFGILAGGGLGVSGALVHEFLPLFDDVHIPRAVSPGETFRSDRLWTLGFRLPFAVVGCALVAMLLAHSWGLRESLVTAASVLPVLATHSAWGRYQWARVWLMIIVGLPWDTMRFLEDAAHRGVLRQVGGVYQFRHILLRDRLAATASINDQMA